MIVPPFGIVTESTIGPVPFAAQTAPADPTHDHDVIVIPACGVSVNVGVVSGGTRPNVVPEEAIAIVDVRAPTLDDAARIDAACLPQPLTTAHNGPASGDDEGAAATVGASDDPQSLGAVSPRLCFESVCSGGVD